MKINIFKCNNDTRQECLRRNLFGEGAGWVLNVRSGELCLLFNYSTRTLTGVFEAVSDASRNLEPEAWGGRFPNQVRVKKKSTDLITIPVSVIRQLVCHPNGDQIRPFVVGDDAEMVSRKFFEADTGIANQHQLSLLPADPGGDNVMLPEHNPVILPPPPEWEEDYRLRYPRRFLCSDGHMVRSQGEVLIDELLARKRIFHAYEPLLTTPEHIIPDFMVYSATGQSIYIEYWGLAGDPVYDERRRRKEKIYQQHNLYVVDIEERDQQNHNFILQRRLREANVIIAIT